jgi:hypothetical protein
MGGGSGSGPFMTVDAVKGVGPAGRPLLEGLLEKAVVKVSHRNTESYLAETLR